MAEPVTVIIEDEDDSTRVDPSTGTIEIDQPDGGVVVQLDAHRPQEAESEEDPFYANLVGEIGGMRLSQIANDLFDAIQADDESRKNYLQVRARGMDLLGLELKEPKTTVGDSSSAVDGMSTVTNPLLLGCLLDSWANAQAELLPAGGPAKIKDDGDETVAEDDLAETLERGFNHYLMKTLPDWRPDTSHMLLWGNHFGGSGFKKVYRCPMRRRVVSQSVDVKDLIVSDTTKDLGACARVTHQIPMRPSVMKRMMLLGAYRDTSLPQPTPGVNVVDEKISQIQGTGPNRQRPEDEPYTLWESQCEIDLDEFAPANFKGEGIPLPYLVTMDKDSREILSIRRDWREDDKDAKRKRMYVKYPFIPGPGFYGTGLVNMLGNSSAAMTAAWREALDAGMFASFPAGLIAKLAGRQNTSNFRAGPGEFVAVETSAQSIKDVVMPMPFHDVTPGLMQMMDKITQQTKDMAGKANIPTAEGIQNVPVGTMLAQIEQATKIMAASHKGMHEAMSEEFELIIELLRENPEDFWRGNKECPDGYWNAEKLVAALDDCRLVPVSDPNVPSHLHRVMKALALIQLLAVFPQELSREEVLRRCLAAIKEDPAGLVVQAPPAAAAPPNPADLAKLQDSQTKQAKLQLDAAALAQKTDNEDKMLAAEKELKTLDLTKELIIHQGDQAKAERDTARDNLLAAQQHELAVRDHGLARQSHALDVAKHGLDVHQALNSPPKVPQP